MGYAKDNWIIFMGYPLTGQFDPAQCFTHLEQIRAAYQPEIVWFIGPEIPSALQSSCSKRESDQYYTLALDQLHIKSSLKRQVNRAAEKLQIEESHQFRKEHQALVDELTSRQTLPPLIEELYSSMPAYLAACQSAILLDARDTDGGLAAFFVIETAAKNFDTYMLGCHSKKNYIPHASDLLFMEMIRQAEQRGKPGINLGLGVNPGIRRFKTKWGGQPTLPYEFCECTYGSPNPLSILDQLLGKGL